jgi:hypothetical protein
MLHCTPLFVAQDVIQLKQVLAFLLGRVLIIDFGLIHIYQIEEWPGLLDLLKMHAFQENLGIKNYLLSAANPERQMINSCPLANKNLNKSEAGGADLGRPRP